VIEHTGIVLTIALVILLLVREAVAGGAVRAAPWTRPLATVAIAVLGSTFVAVVVQRIIDLT
jgi:hypothetical protein